MAWLLACACRFTAGRKSAPPRFGFLPGLMVVLAFVFSASAASFTASMDRPFVLQGEMANLSLTFEDCQPQRVPALPNIAQLRIEYLGPIQQQTIVNGQQRSTVTLRFNVIPQQPGNFTIPALTVELEGKRLSTQPLRLKVLPAAEFGPPASMGNQVAFLWLVVPRKEYYLQEVVLAELRLYQRNGLRLGNAQAPAPSGEGFTAAKMVQGQPIQSSVGNVPFSVVPLTVALTPVKTGTLKLDPINGSVVLNPRDPFGFESFFARRPPPQEIPLKLEGCELRVLPLPAENAPTGFSGAVGDYQLEFSAGPTQVAVGDPITVKVRIVGRGALDNVTLPEQSAWKDFKTYPPMAEVKTGDPLGLQGAKWFEQVVVPQSTEVKELPSLSFSYFDPEQKAYRTLTAPATPLVVRPGGATPAPVIAAAKTPAAEAPPPAPDIVGLKQHPGAMSMTQPPLALRSGFWLLQAVPLLGWLAAVVWRKRTDALARNPRLRRKRQVAQVVADGLTELRQLAAERKSEAFFATLFRVLQEQIGERLDLPASAITEAIVNERLKPAGLEAGDQAALHELFQTCNLARYAPTHSGQELAALVPRVEAVIQKLQRLEA